MDLLASLREERGKHSRWGGACGYCGECIGDPPWPCKISRALDCAIAGAELAVKQLAIHAKPCGGACLDSQRATEALAAMQRAWEGKL